MNTDKINQRLADEEMLQNFLLTWPIEDLADMTLAEYNDVGNKETFCQYVETKTRPLGSIKGMNSIKFGIYKRRDKEKRPKHAVSNSHYTWQRRYNDKDLDEQQAFAGVIREIQSIADLAEAGDFAAIEHFILPSIFRWKVAFLYSGNRLIPIFSKINLIEIVKRMGMSADYRTPYYQMQEYLIARKRYDETVVEYMRRLYTEHRIKTDKVPKKPKRHPRRRGATTKNTNLQPRKGNEGYVAGQFHNEIQNTLYDSLCAEHGKENVNMELDWVDLMVTLPDRVILYEIKSDKWAADCIIKGLGQVLGYAFKAQQDHSKPIELVIAGANPQNASEKEMTDFLFSQIKLPVRYLKIE